MLSNCSGLGCNRRCDVKRNPAKAERKGLSEITMLHVLRQKKNKEEERKKGIPLPS